jgi:hypothetical protein
MTKYRMNLVPTSNRGGTAIYKNILVTPIGNNVVCKVPDPYDNGVSLYGIYTKAGKLIKSGFDSHKLAMIYAHKIQ